MAGVTTREEAPTHAALASQWGGNPRLTGLTEPVATSPAKAHATTKLGGFAEQQAALRRVATLVAGGAPAEEVFAAVAAEVGALIDADLAGVSRYDPAGTATFVGVWTRPGTPKPPASIDTPVAHGGRNLHTLVFDTGRPVRIDEYAVVASGPTAAVVRGLGLRAGVAVPIRVEGRLWGVMIAASTRQESLPAGVEARLAGFTELVATALADAQARTELRGFAAEQAALHRVATLVARGGLPEEVFAAVTAEVGRLLTADDTVLCRYDADGLATVLGHQVLTDRGRPPAVGLRLQLEGWNVATQVAQTGRSARIDDYGIASGAFADVARDWEFRAAVGVPIRVEGRLWGVISVGSRSGPLPAGTETRLAGFTELVATAIANAEARAALTASRARVVAAGDETRRRMERDLHDGIQQGLLALILQAAAAGELRDDEADQMRTELVELRQGLVAALDELRETARGIHPAILTEAGLGAALASLGRRCPVPVILEYQAAGPLPEPVEVAAYYVVAEALSNAVKHAQASEIEVVVVRRDGKLCVRIRDDGRGGAELGSGSGLVGLTDRVEALGGRLTVHSPPGAGTTLEAVLRLTDPSEPPLPRPGTGPTDGTGSAPSVEPNHPAQARAR